MASKRGEIMETFDEEKVVFENYKNIPSSKIKYNGRFFHCLHIEKLTRSFFFNNSWINSSGKNDLPPDFHNDKHQIMLEVMRIDDCVNELNGKHVSNSFEKANVFMKNVAGRDYKKTLNGTLIFIPDTRNSNDFNFNGYLTNFEKVIRGHSEKVAKYRLNYPKCKTIVFLVCDESNNYIQVLDKNDLEREDEKDVFINRFYPHYQFDDARFIDIIKKCSADYLIWFGRFKSLYINNKEINYPRVCIYDIKHIKRNGLTYNHDLMFKVKEEQVNELL